MPITPQPVRLIGSSTAIARLRALIAQVGPSDAPVLVTGPSGSGKELAARAIHAASARARGPFIAVNCGAIPRDLLESELFGHERGAFTGAHATRIGKFEAAAGGTLFLDEIGDMPIDMQVSLLRVLEEKRFERVGSTVTQPTDVRIVSATHRDLDAAILDGRFREDLYYRLNVLPIRMPALGDRREDVPELIAHFCVPLGERAPLFAADARARLLVHDWPGNVRELRNFVERAAVRYTDAPLTAVDVEAALQRPVTDAPQERRRYRLPLLATPPSPPAPTFLDRFPGLDPARLLAHGGFDLRAAITDLERGLIEAALAVSDDVVADAARVLGLQRTTLVEKMRRLDVRRSSGEAALLAA